MDDCIFCKVIAGTMPSHKIYEDEQILAFLDIRPVNIGHTLILPKAHTTDFRETSEEDLAYIMAVVKKIAPAILDAVGASSFNFTSNIGRASGQSIFHTHFHIIPRFPTDGYKPWVREDDGHEDFKSLAEKIRKTIQL